MKVKTIKEKLFTKLTIITLLTVAFFGINQHNIYGAEITVNSISELEEKYTQATEDTTFILSDSFPTVLTETIDLNTTYEGTLTIDGQDKELTIANNTRHLQVAANSKGLTVFQNLFLSGNATLDSNGRPTIAAGAQSGMQIGDHAKVKIIDSKFYNNYIGGNGGAIRALYNSEVEIDNCVFNSNIAAGHGGAIGGGDNNSAKNLNVTNSTFTNNLGNASSFGGYIGGAITLRNPHGTINISNNYFENNATAGSGNGGGGGGALAISSAENQSGFTAMIKDNYFIDNRAVLAETTTVTGDGGAIYLFNINAKTTISIDGNTFDSNIAADDGGAILLQVNDGTTASIGIEIVNSTFYNNQALGKGDDPVISAGFSGGAIQIFKNGGTLRSHRLNIKSSTFVGNSAKNNIEGQNQRGGAITTSGSSNYTVVLDGSLFVDNMVLDVDGTPIAANVNYSNIFASRITNNSSVGVDNGSSTATKATIENIFAGFEPTLQENDSVVKAGSTLSGQVVVPTIMIVPNTGTTGLADNVVTPANAASDDERDFMRGSTKADAGALEIGWIKYHENEGTWTLPELTSYDGKTFYEGTSPEEKYQVGYINEATATISDSGLARTGYTFLGWDEDPAATTPTYKIGDAITISDENTLYAIWEEIEKLSVTYDGNGYTSAETTIPLDTNSPYDPDSTVTVLGKGDLEKTNWTFTGWNTKADGSGSAYVAGDTFTITEHTILYAQWTENAKYNITYDGNTNTGGTAPTDENNPYYVNTEATILDKDTLTKTNWTFTGWNTEPDGSGTAYPVNGTVIVESDLTLYAQWVENDKVAVTYYGNGHTDGEAPVDEERYHVNDLVTVLDANTLEKDNWTFIGWNTESDGSGTAYLPGGEFNIEDNTSLYAQWQENDKYSVIYNGNGHTDGAVPTDANNYYDAEEATILGQNTLVKEGFTFLGWSTDPNATEATYTENDLILVNGDTTLYAVWQEIIKEVTYTVTYDGNTNTGGTAPVDSKEYLSGDNTTTLGKDSLVKSGYNFTGWNTSADGSGTFYPVGSNLIIDGDITLFAQWTLATTPTTKVTVTFDKNDSKAKNGSVTKQTLTKGSSISKDNKKMGNPIRTGYKLVGWCTTNKKCIPVNGDSASLVGTQFTKNTAVNQNIIVYAQWVKIKNVTPDTGQDPKMMIITISLGIVASLGYGIYRLRKNY
ncbi:InlB B-repeat-containing protein [Erysipelotrichaceae bacterium OttesenSCG-928-M19]|nr:InlB B-repeat-containing protein [Erysipelotrichaceae bacterium OttesenSCG-928-M19]